MKVSALACLAGCLGVTSAMFPATPEDDVKAVLQDFLDQPNYSWGATKSRGLPENTGEQIGEEISGQHEKGGLTLIALVKGPHIPRDVPPKKAWLGITPDDAFWSSRWVFETPEGWKRLSTLPLPPPNTGRRPGGVGIGVGASVSFRYFGAWRPDQEVSVILESIANVEASPSGFEIELTTEGARKLATVPSMPAFAALFAPAWENLHGVVKVVLRGKTLAGYEIFIEGTRIPPIGPRGPVTIDRVRELKDVGTTVIEVPEEAQPLLPR